MPSSKNSLPGSISLAMRSRAVSRPFLCCASIGSGRRPRQLFFLVLMADTRSIMRRVFFSNSGELRFTRDPSTERDKGKASRLKLAARCYASGERRTVYLV